MPLRVPQTHIAVGLIALLLAILLLGLWVRWPTQRTTYRPYVLTSFQQSYRTAQHAHESWHREPTTVALRIAGYPNPDGIPPTNIAVHFPTPDTAIVIVTASQLMDDSLAAREVRVDLFRHDQEWMVEWAGQRVRCRRDLFGALWWQTGPCP